jgi:hypothetical protein
MCHWKLYWHISSTGLFEWHPSKPEKEVGGQASQQAAAKHALFLTLK